MKLLDRVHAEFASRKVVEALREYIQVPNVSPSFDPDIFKNGLQEKALNVLTTWLKNQGIKGCTWEVFAEPDRTPLLLVEIQPSDSADSTTTLMYGHFDKQPPFDGWMEGTGPYMPKVIDGKLYGRGGADDGYSLFASIVAIASLQKELMPHPRIVILIEGSEESGSRDLPFYMEKEVIKRTIGNPNLVICLDSGAGNYEQLWVTTSLRGIVVGDLTVKVLTEGAHSGDASGVVPSSFRIARDLLSRLEDERTGEILPKELSAVDFDGARRVAVRVAGENLGHQGMVACFPFVEGTQPVTVSMADLAENRWWRPQLEVIGASGLPDSKSAGNVLRPSTTLTLSLRLPPSVDKLSAEACLRKTFLGAPARHNARVEFNIWKSSQGWCAPPLAPWLGEALHNASMTNFNGKEAVYFGEGGSIPFMAMLGNLYPECQFLVCGVLGPGSNAHSSNEFLHLDFCERLIACVADVLSQATKCEHNIEKGEPSNKVARLVGEKLSNEYTRNSDGSKV